MEFAVYDDDDEEFDTNIIKYKGWVFSQSDMTATCPHGYETEIDNDAQDGCKSVLGELGF